MDAGAPGSTSKARRFPPEAVARHHALAVIDHLWPGGAVLCDRSGMHGPVPVDGWLFVCHPDPPRRGDLTLPGLVLSPRVGRTGPLGRHPPARRSRPPGRAGACARRDHHHSRADRRRPSRAPRGHRRGGGPDRGAGPQRRGGGIRVLLGHFDVIAGQLPARPVALVRARLAELLGTSSGRTPVSERLAARVAGDPFDFWAGGGYLEVSTRYAPSTGRLRCFVTMGITASGESGDFAWSNSQGGVYVYFGITAEFQAGGGSKFAIGVMLLLRGEVSLLGIVSAEYQFAA